jgi:hypothetical protein
VYPGKESFKNSNKKAAQWRPFKKHTYYNVVVAVTVAGVVIVLVTVVVAVVVAVVVVLVLTGTHWPLTSSSPAAQSSPGPSGPSGSPGPSSAVPLLLESKPAATKTPAVVATATGAVTLPRAVSRALLPPGISSANELPAKHNATAAAIRIFFITLPFKIDLNATNMILIEYLDYLNSCS